jgi:CheY-like chemotaxis protein
MSTHFQTPARILMADDEEIFLLATADLLRLEGFLVDTARDGFEAADFLRENTYDLLVSDILMPGNQDLDFIRLASELSPDLQVILVTGYPSVGTAVQAIHLPVAAYLTKPIIFEEFLDHIRRAVSSVRTQRAMGRSKERLTGWMEDLDRIQEAVRNAPQAPDRQASREVLGLSLGNIAGVLLDMKALFEMTLEQDSAPEHCTIQACPRLKEYHLAVQETIEVLERTRTAFKSKELGQLRERLELLPIP